MSRRAIPGQSSTSTSSGPASWSGSTASTSAAARHRRRDLAAHRDRHRLLLRLGRARRSASRATPPHARPASSPSASPATSRPPAGSSSGCSATTATSSAASTSPAPSTKLGARHTRIHAGTPADQRQRRSAPQDDPRRVLAPRVRPLHLPPLHRPATRARHLPALLQPRPRPPRPPHPRTHPRRHRLRCPQDGGQMSRTCRHISEAAHLRRRASRQARWHERA